MERTIKIINEKPALEFDKRYGTSISQEWSFPFGHAADDIWVNIQGKSYRDPLSFGPYTDALTGEHFPYKDLDKLNYDEKCDVLMGMCSGINMDDILYFVVEKVFGYMNGEISNTLDSMGLKHGWVVSPKTLARIKEQLKN